MQTDLDHEFKKYGRWITKFTIEGRTFGGEYDAANDVRLDMFRKRFAGVKRILELGSLEGGHSFALTSLPGVEQVVAIEGRKSSMEKSLFVQKLLKQEKVKFVRANLERFDLKQLGRFDVVFCVGLLYHLPKPWKLLERIGETSDAIFLWTHYAPPEKAKITRHTYEGFYYREWKFLWEALSGFSPRSFWPGRSALLKMLSDVGFSDIAVEEDATQHVHGPAITLSARKPNG